MVTVHTRKQAEELRDELNTLIAGDEYPADVRIANTVTQAVVISSRQHGRVRYIDRDPEIPT